MKLLAISSINKDKEVIGARLLDTDNLKVSNCNIEQIAHIIKQGNTLRNITLEKDKIVWTQGTNSRYPSINILYNNEVSNTNSIIVVGYYEISGAKEYSVANYRGELVTLTEEKLIKYGEQYTLANCKITTKDNKSYVASLYGELEKLNDQAEFGYNIDRKTIIVKLPNRGISKLEIPSRINGSETIHAEAIYLRQSEPANKITHLILPKKLKGLNEELLSMLKGLKVLECESNLSYTHPNTFSNCKELTDIHFKGITRWPYRLFRDLAHLKNLNIERKILNIGSEMFKNCTSLNVDSVITEELSSIGAGAFEGCTQIEKMTIPRSVTWINTSAFKGCTNIKELRITNNSLKLELYTIYIEDAETSLKYKLLQDSPNAILYCPYSYPESILKECVAGHIKIIREEPTESDLELGNKAIKASMLGIRVNQSDISRNSREAIGFLTIVNEQNWKESIANCIRDYMGLKNWHNGRYLLNNRSANLSIYIGGISYRGSRKCKQAKIGQKYMYAMSNTRLDILLIDRNLIKEKIEKSRQKGLPNELNLNRSRGGRTSSLEEKEFILEIPHHFINIVPDDIAKIFELGDSLVIEYSNGKQSTISLG